MASCLMSPVSGSVEEAVEFDLIFLNGSIVRQRIARFGRAEAGHETCRGAQFRGDQAGDGVSGFGAAEECQYRRQDCSESISRVCLGGAHARPCLISCSGASANLCQESSLGALPLSGRAISMRPHCEALLGNEIRQGGMIIHSLFQTVGERDPRPRGAVQL